MRILRAILTTTVIGVLVLSVGCGKGKSESETTGAVQTVKLTYANFPPAGTFPCVQMDRWAEEVARLSADQIKVETFPGSQLLGAKNMLDGVIDGTADIGCFAMSYHPGQFPLSEAIDMPHFFPSATCATMVLEDLIEKYQPKEFEKVELLAVFTCPPVAVMSSTEVSSLADLSGMTLRSSGTGAKVVKALGGVPDSMPQSDVPAAIQKGTVKGIVTSSEVLKDMNYAAYCPYTLDVKLNVVTFAVVMNREKFQSLPEDTQKMLKDLAKDQGEWTGKYVDEHVKEALEWATKEKGHKIVSLPPEQLAAVQEKLRPLVDEYVKRADAAGLPGKEIVADIEALKEKYADK